MKPPLRNTGRSVVALACGLALAGCEPKQKTSEEPVSADRNTNASSLVNSVANSASNVINSASNALSAVGDKARTIVSSTTNVDNSGINSRDRSGATLTPGDQGNSPTDRELTQQIRKALVMGTNDFSVVAQNVKIITTDGKVTLRGPVNTESEKNGIAALARTFAGEGNVDNQIDVKPTQ